MTPESHRVLEEVQKSIVDVPAVGLDVEPRSPRRPTEIEEVSRVQVLHEVSSDRVYPEKGPQTRCCLLQLPGHSRGVSLRPFDLLGVHVNHYRQLKTQCIAQGRISEA